MVEETRAKSAKIACLSALPAQQRIEHSTAVFGKRKVIAGVTLN
jgi:hypothetical protein